MTPALDASACMASAWQVAPDLPLRLVVVSGLMTVAGWSDAQGPFPGKRAFFWLNVALALWIAGSTAEHAAVDAGCKATIALISWPAVMVMPAVWTLFLWQYVGREQDVPPVHTVVLALLGVGLMSTMALSNGHHGLFYTAATTLGPPLYGLPRMQYAYGPLFFVAAAWGYAWLLSATAIIVRAIGDCAPEDRAQWIAFLVMMLVPWGANVAYLVGGVRLLGGDPTPLSFAIAVVGFSWLIRSSSLLSVVPMSRRLLFTDLPDPVLVLDSVGRVVDCNRAAATLAAQRGTPPADDETPPAVAPTGRPLAEWPVFGPALAELLAREGLRGGTLSLEEPTQVFDVQVRDLGRRSSRIGRLLQLRDVTDRHRATVHLVNALAQRDEQLQQVAQLEAELREQALRDPLTGLQNRRALAQRFEAERQHQLATGGPLTLVLVDVDHFKRINDEFGHAEGDRVLATLGLTIGEGLRSSDAVFRIGGEEFALLMPGADSQQAMQRVESLHLRTRAALRRDDGGSVSFSAGIATCRDACTSLDELLRLADGALYAAKAAGRARSVLADDLPPAAALQPASR